MLKYHVTQSTITSLSILIMKSRPRIPYVYQNDTSGLILRTSSEQEHSSVTERTTRVDHLEQHINAGEKYKREFTSSKYLNLPHLTGLDIQSYSFNP